jgi:hypothetical protein
MNELGVGDVITWVLWEMALSASMAISREETAPSNSRSMLKVRKWFAMW